MENQSLENSAHSTPLTGVVQGEPQLQEALVKSMIYACEQRVNTLILSDPDFSLWPLNQPDLLSALSSWAASHSNRRKMIVMAATYQLVLKQHHAWLRWRKQWDHRIECLQLLPEENIEIQPIFWSEVIQVAIKNTESATGVVSVEKRLLIPNEAKLLGQRGFCEVALPASTIGL